MGFLGALKGAFGVGNPVTKAATGALKATSPALQSPGVMKVASPLGAKMLGGRASAAGGAPGLSAGAGAMAGPKDMAGLKGLAQGALGAPPPGSKPIAEGGAFTPGRRRFGAGRSMRGRRR
jgi:hypothetical protein